VGRDGEAISFADGRTPVPIWEPHLCVLHFNTKRLLHFRTEKVNIIATREKLLNADVGGSKVSIRTLFTHGITFSGQCMLMYFMLCFCFYFIYFIFYSPALVLLFYSIKTMYMFFHVLVSRVAFFVNRHY